MISLTLRALGSGAVLLAALAAAGLLRVHGP